MVKINGIKANSIYGLEKQKEHKPTLNQILDKMENNYQTINYIYNKNTNANSSSNIFDAHDQSFQNQSSLINDDVKIQNQESQNVFSSLLKNFSTNQDYSVNTMDISNQNNDSLLMSVLPLLLNNKGKNGLKNGQDLIFKEMVKNTQNPRLAQIVKLLPKLINNKINTFADIQENMPKKEEPKIDSYTKTDEYYE